MAIRDYILYWTDDFNPPRYLTVTVEGPSGEFPFPELRDALLEEDEDMDMEEMAVYSFVTNDFSYGTETGVNLFSSEDNAIFGELPEGTPVAFKLGTFNHPGVYFARRGVRSNLDYSLSVEVPDYEDIQSQDMIYEGCAAEPFNDEEELLLFSSWMWHSVPEFPDDDVIRVRAGRLGGGVIVYFPCNWSVPRTIRYKYGSISGWLVLPDEIQFSHNPEVDVRLTKWWPEDEED